MAQRKGRIRARGNAKMVKGIMGVSNKQQTVAVALDPLPEKWEWRAKETKRRQKKSESHREMMER